MSGSPQESPPQPNQKHSQSFGINYHRGYKHFLPPSVNQENLLFSLPAVSCILRKILHPSSLFGSMQRTMLYLCSYPLSVHRAWAFGSHHHSSLQYIYPFASDRPLHESRLSCLDILQYPSNRPAHQRHLSPHWSHPYSAPLQKGSRSTLRNAVSQA